MALNQQDNQAVYVLHTYPFKETSLVVELFTQTHGRVTAVAKGARRPRSAIRGMLQTFQQFSATWSGKAELKNLHGLESVSYTHLDVYKRQPLRRQYAIRNEAAARHDTVSYTHLDVYKRQCLACVCCKIARFGALMSVSYTHLDVYKRQALH